jgi:hypothetical protein
MYGTSELIELEESRLLLLLCYFVSLLTPKTTPVLLLTNLQTNLVAFSRRVGLVVFFQQIMSGHLAFI